MTLTLQPLLVLWSRKNRAIPLLPLWAVRPVQSLSACKRVHFTFTFNLSTKFHENLSSENRADVYGQMEGYEEAKRCFSRSREKHLLAYVLTIFSSSCPTVFRSTDVIFKIPCNLNCFSNKRPHEIKVKIKVKFTQEQATKNQRGGYRYSPALSLTSAIDGVGGQRHAPTALARERPGTNCIGGWVGTRAGLDGCGNSHPYRDSIPGPFSPQRVARPTDLSRPTST